MISVSSMSPNFKQYEKGKSDQGQTCIGDEMVTSSVRWARLSPLEEIRVITALPQLHCNV